MRIPSSLLYDKQDYFFLERVNQTIECNKNTPSKSQIIMHPHGIIDLTTAPELRMASAVLSLLDTLESRNPEERLLALENLHSEVLLAANSKFRRNTARVLIEIMKEIVRSYGDQERQLQLIHDFRMAAGGNPTKVRPLLKRYQLLEMPECWNQLVFDHHVHDANTKGRKSPTHLIMDAWIKGIRSMTIIYFHYVSLEAGTELIKAAKIMGIKIRIGILYNMVFRHKLLNIIWVPQVFHDSQSFISFLETPEVMRLNNEGKEVSKWKESFMLNILNDWNLHLKAKVEKLHHISLDTIGKNEFFNFVGRGQASVIHLSELIHKKCLPLLLKKVDSLKKDLLSTTKTEEKQILQDKVAQIDQLTPEYFLDILEQSEQLQEKLMVAKIIATEPDTPEVLQLSPKDLVKRLDSLGSENSITLNLAGVCPEDALNLLWDCHGLITHVEIFNVNDWHRGKSPFTLEINNLIQAINHSNTPNLKQIIQGLIDVCQKEEEQSFFENRINHIRYKAILSASKKLSILKTTTPEYLDLEETDEMDDLDLETQESAHIQNTHALITSTPNEHLHTENVEYCHKVQVKLHSEKNLHKLLRKKKIDKHRAEQKNYLDSKKLTQKLIEDETQIVLEKEQKINQENESIRQNQALTENNADASNLSEQTLTDTCADTHFCWYNTSVRVYEKDERFILISKEERIEKLRAILHNIVAFIEVYAEKKIFTRMGSDATSRVDRLAGMGLAYAETLPKRAQKELRSASSTYRLRLPVRKELTKVNTAKFPYVGEKISPSVKILRHIPWVKHFTLSTSVDFEDYEASTSVFNDGMCSNNTKSFPITQGNIVTLGNVGFRSNNQLDGHEEKDRNTSILPYLNTNIINILKLLLGFIPAFFSFWFTQEVSLLAWFGALIWFLITGLRNIVQAVLGGGGVKRSTLLHWSKYVSWSRICDSLMYTGLSVVLLELITKNLVLQNTFNLNSLNAPLLTFTIISFINSLYIVGHNIFRGLQIEAILGNFFRSIFAIPLSLFYNNVFFALLLVLEVQDASIILLSSSAILSKLASDTVAGIIEGIADKRSNIWFRQWDYKIATNTLYTNYSLLEVEFTEEDALSMMKNPQKTLTILKEQNPKLYTSLILNALDFMYFYYFQPRALSTLKEIISGLSDIERLAWLHLQYVLNCQRDVSQLFIDGYFGDNFSKALSFYLDNHEHYIKKQEDLYKTRLQKLVE